MGLPGTPVTTLSAPVDIGMIKIPGKQGIVILIIFYIS